MSTACFCGHHQMSVPGVYLLGCVPSRGCTRHTQSPKLRETRHTHPFHCGQNDRHLWKHYLPTTLLVDGKYHILSNSSFCTSNAPLQCILCSSPWWQAEFHEERTWKYRFLHWIRINMMCCPWTPLRMQPQQYMVIEGQGHTHLHMDDLPIRACSS